MQPDGNGTVTIVLPVTTDCASQGAVCTEDGRMLSRQAGVDRLWAVAGSRSRPAPKHRRVSYMGERRNTKWPFPCRCVGRGPPLEWSTVHRRLAAGGYGDATPRLPCWSYRIARRRAVGGRRLPSAVPRFAADRRRSRRGAAPRYHHQLEGREQPALRILSQLGPARPPADELPGRMEEAAKGRYP